MATGGAWASETFDNGRDFHQQAPAAGAPATSPAMYNAPATGNKGGSSLFGVAAFCLRIAQIVFTLIAFSVMAANRETLTEISDTGDYDTLHFKFSSVNAFTGVLAVNCIVCFYAIVQLVQCFVNMGTQGSFISSPTTVFATLTFVFDSVMAYALMGASAAGADSAAFLSDQNYCSEVDSFCQKAQASVAMSFFAFALLAMSVALFPIRLLRLTKTKA